MAMTERAGRQSMTFFQLGGVYRVNGRWTDARSISTRGIGETFAEVNPYAQTFRRTEPWVGDGDGVIHGGRLVAERRSRSSSAGR
jgi:hypothetical protein